MMNKVRKLQGQNFLTISTAFMVWWWSYQGFRFSFNGFFQSFMGGRFGSFLFLIYCIIYFFGRFQHPAMFGNNNKKSAALFALISMIICMLSVIIAGQFIVGDFFILAFIGWTILTFNDETRMKVFNAFLTITIVLLCLSLVEFIIYGLTDKFIVLGTVKRHFASGRGQVLFQTLFNLIDIDSDIPRFQSLYEEPGNLGNVCILIIFMTSGKYRFAHIVAWIAGVISFSLGFYLLAIVYLIGQNIKIKYLLLAGIFLVSFANLPFLSERFDNLIVHRVQDRTLEEIDNRTNYELDTALKKSYENGTIWFGHGGVLPASIEYNSGVSGAKPFIYRYGLIMSFFILMFYIVNFARQSINYKMTRRSQIAFIVFFLFSFYKSALVFQSFFILMFFLYPYSSFITSQEKSKTRLPHNKKVVLS